MDKPHFGAFRAAQVKRDRNRCEAEYIVMRKRCTLPRGHEGNHCEEKQCGDKVIKFWWNRDEAYIGTNSEGRA
jgi:hypothetical protein